MDILPEEHPVRPSGHGHGHGGGHGHGHDCEPEDYFGWPPCDAHPRRTVWNAESTLNPVSVILATFVLVTFGALGGLLAIIGFIIFGYLLLQFYL
jgi:hypothetical protein